MPAEYSLIKNSYNSIARKDFWCLKITINKNADIMQEARRIADSIVEKLNSGQANSSEIRSMKTIEIDNLSGIIAELTCYYILKYLYGENKIIKPPSRTSYNQIDLELFNKKQSKYDLLASETGSGLRCSNSTKQIRMNNILTY